MLSAKQQKIPRFFLQPSPTMIAQISMDRPLFSSSNPTLKPTTVVLLYMSLLVGLPTNLLMNFSATRKTKGTNSFASCMPIPQPVRPWAGCLRRLPIISWPTKRISPFIGVTETQRLYRFLFARLAWLIRVFLPQTILGLMVQSF